MAGMDHYDEWVHSSESEQSDVGSAGAEPRLWAMIEVCEIPEALYSTDDSQLGPGLTFCELSGHSSAFVLQTQS